MPTNLFHPVIQQWFERRFGRPTPPQVQGWPAIASRQNTLIAAPTGSGKTLAAFLVSLDQLLRDDLAGDLGDETRVVYVSPLRALSNDIQRNLQAPLAEIAAEAARLGYGPVSIRAAVRTGDTTQRERQQMRRKPPHILVTTPESLYLLVTSAKSRDALRSVRTIIVDEIHALARDKRGSHLALTLERLSSLCPVRPVRIGLSATQRPLDQIAHFLTGVDVTRTVPLAAASPEPPEAPTDRALAPAPEPVPAPCQILDIGHLREIDLNVVVPPSEMSAVCSNEQWEETYAALVEHIQAHRSTLVFVNTRRLAERVAHRLRELLGEEAVAAHHGSLARDIRLSAEQRLKDGKLKAIVATASLEMGIDIGYIDLVCQIGSPRSIAALLQRVGRSGHSLGLTPQGRLFPLTRDELLECLALLRAVRHGRLDRLEIPDAPLDVALQQIIAAVACEDRTEADVLNELRRAWPYRHLSWKDFHDLLHLASEGLTATSKLGAYLHWDRIHGTLRARRGARLAAITSGGAIPETGQYRVVTEPEGTFVGSVDEDFAIDSSAGDVFVLGNTSWRITAIRGDEVRVRDAQGAPPTIPFWFGEAPGRTIELSEELSDLRRQIAARLVEIPPAGQTAASAAAQWLRDETGVEAWPAAQAVQYVEAQVAAVGSVPTTEHIVFERFFDESGGMQLVIHAPLGTRVNRAWGLALRKRFCRSFDFELQAAATDNGIVLSIGPQHSFPIEQLFKMLGPQNGQELLEQALLAVPLFPVRWRWNVTRALAVLRFKGGQKVPFFLQRFRADDLLATAFPETVGCLENHSGDIEIPDHPLVRQTMADCLHEAMDVRRWLRVLADAQTGQVTLQPCDTREPSPFSHELINANPYAFLDGAPLEERRTRAVNTRRSLSPADFRDLTRLDPDAIAQVKAEAWPVVRDPDELHDTLQNLVVLDPREAPEWSAWFEQLVAGGRATRFKTPGADGAERTFWIAAERQPLVSAVFPQGICETPVVLPAALAAAPEASAGWVEMARGRMPCAGPVSCGELAERLGLDAGFVHTALEALEGQGLVLRGRFSAQAREAAKSGPVDVTQIEWCDRRLLARIHRLTLDGLRRQIQPTDAADFLRFLLVHQGVTGGRRSGPGAVRDVLGQLEGCEIGAAAWESAVLKSRIPDYDPRWLDDLFMTGELIWGRLRPPKRDADEQDGPAILTRAAPLAVAFREHLTWLLPPGIADPSETASDGARRVLEALRRRGALFSAELRQASRLAPEPLDAALRELVALGLVTADGFAAVRSLGATREASESPAVPYGRWSLFPRDDESEAATSGVTNEAPPAPRGSITPEVERAAKGIERLEWWCQLLLRRYGVVFRDLLVRETAAPSWGELVPLLRRKELRGELRGGRFVQGVSGEQFATEGAVTKLREVREHPDDGWIVISASDPLNLSGTVVAGPRVPALPRNALALRGGRCIAAKRGREVEFFAEVSEAEQAEIRLALTRGRKRGRKATTRAAGLSPAAPVADAAPSPGVTSPPVAAPPPDRRGIERDATPSPTASLNVTDADEAARRVRSRKPRPDGAEGRAIPTSSYLRPSPPPDDGSDTSRRRIARDIRRRWNKFS